MSPYEGKVPLPTIYLGLARMLPVGETDEAQIQNETTNLHEEDAALIKSFVNKVILNSVDKDSETFTGLSVKNTQKRTKHPPYMHSSLSASLGQDSLSSIASAVASFNKLQREMGEDYPGGILVIDELDAGFHPHAQQKLIKALLSESSRLSLQIIATTHSPRLVELIFQQEETTDNKKTKNKNLNKAIYLANTNRPRIENWSIDGILEDMSLLPKIKKVIPKPERLKIYFEDNQAANFFKCILKMKKDYKTINKLQFKVVPIGVGGSNITGLPGYDPYFKTVMLVVDADTDIPTDLKNVLKLPSPKGKKQSPEKVMYTYIEQLINNDESQCPNGQKAMRLAEISTDRLREELLQDTESYDEKMKERKRLKKWFNSKYELLKQYNLFEYWAKDHSEEVEIFKTNLENTLNIVAQRNSSV